MRPTSRFGGGTGVLRDFLLAGLVDRLHLSIALIVMGRGTRFWDDARMLKGEVTSETSEGGTIYVSIRRLRDGGTGRRRDAPGPRLSRVVPLAG